MNSRWSSHCVLKKSQHIPKGGKVIPTSENILLRPGFMVCQVGMNKFWEESKKA